jgi:hypothetical protein
MLIDYYGPMPAQFSVTLQFFKELNDPSVLLPAIARDQLGE